MRSHPAAGAPARRGTDLLSALAAARLAFAALRRRPPGGPARWERRNHRGEAVTLLEGPAAVAGALAAVAAARKDDVRRAALLAGAAAGLLGLLDDLAGSPAARGLRGHLRALGHGEVTTGAVKLAGLGVAGLAAGALLRRDRVDAVLAGGVIAGTANLVNLLDLRPGRAGKAVLVLTADQVVRRRTGSLPAAAAAGATLAVLPDDLRERAMLGDAGANGLGALAGVAAAAGASRTGLTLRLAALVALTLASERVSFSRVIDAVAPLRAVDQLGRRAPDVPLATGTVAVGVASGRGSGG